MNNSLMAVRIAARSTRAGQVQEVLTKYGCNIKTRIGFHETSESSCATDGIIIMQLFGKDEEIKEMQEALNGISDVQAKFIEF
ncbi:MAG: hypothetical protein WBI07_02310 [Mobilitalea sp.]